MTLQKSSGDFMSNNCFKLSPYSEIPSYVDQWVISEIENVWGEKIPNYLYPIGGPMLIGWVKMCRIKNSEENIFYGEYWSKEERIKGEFEYFHPQSKPLPTHLFDRYELSSYVNGEGIYAYPISGDTPPIDYFLLKVRDIKDIQRPEI